MHTSDSFYLTNNTVFIIINKFNLITNEIVNICVSIHEYLREYQPFYFVLLQITTVIKYIHKKDKSER